MSASPSRAENSKRRRITRACDRCHRSGIKCASSNDPQSCEPCLTYNVTCTYDRPVKRRGPAARSKEESKPTLPWFQDDWTYHEVASLQAILDLAEAYHAVVYPIQHYYHWPSFISDIQLQRYTHDQPFFSSVMALCALASARLRDGACLALRNHTMSLENYPKSEEFYEVSISAIPKDPARALDFNYKRAKSTLALLCIQYGDVSHLHTHLGDYLTICQIDGFYNEARWPQDLDEIQIQERRRLFWSTYQLDVYSAVTWGGIIRHRDSECSVRYPTEVSDDTDITPHQILFPQGTSWLKGWNFTTDLYRILEHAVVELRSRKHNFDVDQDARVATLCQKTIGPSSDVILNVISAGHLALPDEFRRTEAVNGNPAHDRIGFQAVNIIITMQTVRMVLAASEDSSVSDRCAIAGHLLDAISDVPTAYIQAISTPTLHHLAGVGHLLGSVIQSPLSQWQYLQVRNVLLSLATLLGTLESSLSSAAGIADRLKSHVQRIDQYMNEAALERSRKNQVWHGLQTPKEEPSQVAPPAPQVTQPEPPKNDSQVILPDDLFIDWPFDFGGQAFDFMADFTSANGVQQ